MKGNTDIRNLLHANWLSVLLLLCLYGCPATHAQDTFFSISGKVIDKDSRQGVAYCNVYIEGDSASWTSTDSLGIFRMKKARPGIHRLYASCIGYKAALTAEYMISSATPFVEIELEEDTRLMGEVSIGPTLMRRSSESPVSLHVIGMQDIEKMPGANRDISRIVRAFPGVSFSPIGYRNDLIVRGGGPAENRFFMDGIEIPNINHFATQGASGGPTSIVNADLVREINFYTGAFPSDRSGALSSVLDFALVNGNPDRQTFKATLGASEVSLSGNGHFSPKTTYLFSVRQSYLHLLFKVLGLPFLPNYIDGQFKIKSRITPKDELMFMALGGIDRMKLNTDEEGEENEYLLSYLPVIRQETYTLGASYKHYAGRHTTGVYLSHNYLNNRLTKYNDNDESSEANLRQRAKSTDQKTSLRVENRTALEQWTWKQGAEGNYVQHRNRTRQRIYTDMAGWTDYRTALGVWTWGVFTSLDYQSANERFSASAGLRTDAANLALMRNPLEQLSPRISVRYALPPQWSVAANAGIFYQLPTGTALGYKDKNGTLANNRLKYQKVTSESMGVSWRPSRQLVFTLEGFHKIYRRMPLSVMDNIPLACKGNDYGVVGNEPLTPNAEGRSYGMELLGKWQIPDKISATASFTLFKSEYRNGKSAAYTPSAWDNRYILNLSAVWELPRRWSVGGKLSLIGGAPYTPYDVEKSSLVEAWDAQGRAYFDYSRYNAERLPAFAQLDIRIDKNYYFRKWRLGFYVGLENATASKLKQQDALLSTGVVENPTAPASQQRYVMKTLKQESGSMVPSIGLTAEF